MVKTTSIFFISFVSILGVLIMVDIVEASSPILNFSDITSGPKTGNTDGIGSGAIVTIWGNYLGSAQGSSKIYVGDVEATAVYYWKNADGQLPGGPADLYTYHKMQEITFAIPSSAPNGETTIKVVVGGINSTTLPFTVRAGNIYFVKSTGNDTTGNGSWENAWANLSNALSGDGKISAGDVIYSVGVGSMSDVNIGSTTAQVGTLSDPYSVICYPNISCSATNGNTANFRNWNGANRYWNFSKFSLATDYQAFSIFQGSRIIGNNVTGPTINSGYSGWVGGGCAGNVSDNCGGHRIYGNEVHDYGAVDGSVDQFQHLFYISNRSGSVAEGFEIAWNNLHDNPIYQGIHIYDQELCGGWSGSINIHHNVVKNQGGNAININFGCVSNPTTINVYNNLTITDTYYNLPGLSAPAAALRVDASSDTVVNIVNNTFSGWASANSVGSGFLTYENNIFLGNRNVAYVSGTPDIYDNNLFYDVVGSPAVPAWAEYSESPRLINYVPELESPVIDSGSDTIVTYSVTDMIGGPHISGNIDIGAIQYVSSEITVRSDVNNSSVTNTTDALLTLRNSLGLSMDGTAWQVGATTGDVDCSGTSNSTDALLILRYSLGLSMGGTSWCE
ncbi:MAG TPA: hypothetical protein DEA46_04165 [Candidatus Moranbacteria bacterium]|nr:hypothetical protein [Candidatus Moranbacteria bacterium]